MFVFLITFIEWAKLIIGCVFFLIGAWTVIRPFIEWIRLTKVTPQTALGCALELVVGLLLTLAGFYITGW